MVLAYHMTIPMIVTIIAPGICGSFFFIKNNAASAPKKILAEGICIDCRDSTIYHSVIYILFVSGNTDISIPNPPAICETKITHPTANKNPCNQAAGISVTYLIILSQYIMSSMIPLHIAMIDKYAGHISIDAQIRTLVKAPAGQKTL